tara:strand:- start:40 stop:174 length:135 start_codon:yes stop_codon:yes gene_type:complete
MSILKINFSNRRRQLKIKKKELELNKAKNNFVKKELSKKTCGCC